MTENKKRIYKLVLGAVLAASSVVLKLAFDMWIRTDFFGFPFYSIPLILAGLLLGVRYSLIVGFVADTVSGLIIGYLPLFVFSTLAWAVVPALLAKETKGVKWWVVIFLTYLISSLLNTFAIWAHFSKAGALGSLATRLTVLPPFSLIISIVSGYVFERLRGTNLNFGALE